MIIKRMTPASPPARPNKKLVLFFAGWGMDENTFKEYQVPGRDFMIAYNYRSLTFDDTLLIPYDEIKVVAWSMGVWAASQLLQDKNYPVTECVAINGTHFPVDDKKGIPRNVYEGTLNGLNENTLYKFRRRMCGSSDVLKLFLDKAPNRDMEDLRKELEAIGEISSGLPPSHFKWNKIYIGSKDKIFTAGNQIKAWEGTNFTLTDEEHYPRKLWKEVFGK